MEFINNNKGLIVIGGLVAVTIGFLASGNPNDTAKLADNQKPADAKTEQSKEEKAKQEPAKTEEKKVEEQPKKEAAKAEDKKQEAVKPAEPAKKDDAHADHDHKNHEHAASDKDAYMYVAQAGDSYTVLARKAVQTYGIENSVTLSQAQIVAAETFITQKAHTPALHVGQKVAIAKSTVKMFVEKAQKLTKTDVMAWQKYVRYVNFNTSKNGEA